MNLHELRNHIDQRFDNVEKKLDNAIEQSTTNKADIGWLKGYAKIATTIFIAVAGFFAVAYFGK